MSGARSALPGFSSPAVGFEQPFEMLAACHERVQRSLDLLTRLIAHVRTQGHDAQSQSAARDVLRYFDLAAPQHHLDEERHVFPRLLAHGSVHEKVLVQRLQTEHREMETLWAQLRPALQSWSTAHEPAPLAELEPKAQRYTALYEQHLQDENTVVFPAAQARTPEQELTAMGTEMQARRAHTPTAP
jgi:hemerythrin-like domain-containing protein